MTASGDAIQRLTDAPLRQASSQPSWFPDRSAILFRRSGPGRVSSIWRMGLLGETPLLFRDPPGAQFYPSLSADMSRILFATTMSPTGDTDRAIQAMNVDSTAVVTLFDEPRRRERVVRVGRGTRRVCRCQLRRCGCRDV